jgi:hypothetical protein
MCTSLSTQVHPINACRATSPFLLLVVGLVSSRPLHLGAGLLFGLLFRLLFGLLLGLFGTHAISPGVDDQLKTCIVCNAMPSTCPCQRRAPLWASANSVHGLSAIVSTCLSQHMPEVPWSHMARPAACLTASFTVRPANVLDHIISTYRL